MSLLKFIFSRQPWFQNLNHSANDIKMTAAQMITLIAKATEHPLGMAVIKPLVIVLVSNTKDKNTAVQADSEIALVALLRLRESDSHVQVTTLGTLIISHQTSASGIRKNISLMSPISNQAVWDAYALYFFCIPRARVF